jgi:Sulfotransferase domain
VIEAAVSHRADPRWPNLFVVGAAKAGTTSLWRYLAAHPQIVMSRVKEPHFFSRGAVPGLPVAKDERSYLAMFDSAEGAVYRGEASMSYFWDPEAAPAIKARCPDCRIVISLRDPVERAYSHYWTYARLGFESRTFREAVEAELARAEPLDLASVPPPYVSRGFYADQLARYLTRFDRVLVVFFDDLAANVRKTMRALFAFLDLDPGPAETIRPVAHYPFRLPRNRVAARLVFSPRAMRVIPWRLHGLAEAMASTPNKPPLDDPTRMLLRGVYAEHDARLRAQLGRALPWEGRA